MNSSNIRSPSYYTSTAAKGMASSLTLNNHSVQNSQNKKPSKREEGWKEVVRKSKKVVVPSNAISRVIGRGGCNINTIREISGAHIEVEKQKGQGDRNVIIKGSADATRHAQQLIAALSKETEKELSEIIKSLGLSRPTSVSSDEMCSATRNPCKSQSIAAMSSVSRPPNSSLNVQKSSSMSSVGTGLTSIASAFTNRSTLLVRTSAPVAHSMPFINAWNTKTSSSSRMPMVSGGQTSHHSIAINTKSTVSYTMAVTAKGKNTKTTTVSTIVPAVPKVITTSEIKTSSSPMVNQLRPTGAPQGIQPFNQMFAGARVPVPNSSAVVKNNSFLPSNKQPFNLQTLPASQTTTPPSSVTSEVETNNIPNESLNGTTPEYTPFNNLFSKVAQASVWGQSKDKPNFASVAASGLTTMSSSNAVHSQGLPTNLGLSVGQNSTKELSIDASKAPGYRGNLHISPSNASVASTPPSSGSSNLGPIGSGHARSAPCTPPLISSQGQHTPSNSTKTPPLSSTPTPPPQHPLLLQSRSMTDPQNSIFTLTNDNNTAMSGSHSPSHSMNSAPVVSSSAAVTSYHQMIQSNVINSSNLVSPVVSNQMKSQTYGMSSTPLNVPQRHPYVTNTTFSQNSPLPSVGSLPSMQNVSDQNQSVYGANNNSGVQSNLNPNAPDFSARVSLIQSSHQMNGPTIGSQNRMAANSGATVSQNQTIVLQDQMRAAILAASANLQLQTLQKQQAARMQMAANSALHHNHLAANDFGSNTPPPSPETLRLLHTAINSIPTANSTHGLQHFGLMQASNFMPQQIPQQRITQPTLNSLNVRKEMESNTDYEERKQLPRPIGTERAQRKNPTPLYSHNMNALSNMNPTNDTSGMWPFGCGEVSNDMHEWMQTSPQMTNTNIHSSNVSTDNPMSNINQNRFNSSEDFDSTYSVRNH